MSLSLVSLLLGYKYETEWSFDKAYFNFSRVRSRILDSIWKIAPDMVWLDQKYLLNGRKMMFQRNLIHNYLIEYIKFGSDIWLSVLLYLLYMEWGHILAPIESWEYLDSWWIWLEWQHISRALLPSKKVYQGYLLKVIQWYKDRACHKSSAQYCHHCSLT